MSKVKSNNPHPIKEATSQTRIKNLTDTEVFDFLDHQQKAIEKYREVRGRYIDFAGVVGKILENTFKTRNVPYHDIETRAKDLESFGKKASKRDSSDHRKPKYYNPLQDITDLAGIRVITFFPKTLISVDEIIYDEFDVVEKIDKSEKLEEEGKFGYKSIHYLVKMKDNRLALSEYIFSKDLIAEIQARTILQHAWAEMEHDIQYKSADVIPSTIKRRFVALAGMLEIADREFQAIQDEDQEIMVQARIDVKQGELNKVEITPDALKTYLDNRFGTDARVSLTSYDFTASVLRHMGFENFSQIDKCIKDYNDDHVSRSIWDARQGQITRFEDLLLAGMGSNFTTLHIWSDEDWWIDRNQGFIDLLEGADIQIGNYDPNANNL